MTRTQESGCLPVVQVAVVLAEVLGLGLPDPEYISIYPRLAGPAVSADDEMDAISLQFSGAGKLAAVRAWAAEFRVTARVVSVCGNRGEAWLMAYFTRGGVPFCAYADSLAGGA